MAVSTARAVGRGPGYRMERLTRPLRGLDRLIVLVLWAAGIGTAYSAEGPWTTITVPNAVVITSVSPDTVREWMTAAEAYRVIVQSLGMTDPRAQDKMAVVVFRNDAAYGRWFKRPPAALRDDFDDAVPLQNRYRLAGRTSVAVNYDDHEWTRRYFLITAGEWTAQMFPRPLPYWLVTGLGECAAEATVRRDRVEFGDRFNEDADKIRGRVPQAVDRFMATQLAPRMRGALVGNAVYGEAWLIVHFLLWGDAGANRPALIRYIETWERSGSHPAAFAAAFPSGADDLQRRLERYASAGEYRGESVPWSATERASSMQVTPTTEAELAVGMAYVAAHVANYAKAREYLDRAAALTPHAVARFDAECFLAFRRGDTDNAKNLAAQAVAAGSVWPEAHLYAARLKASSFLCREFTIDRVDGAKAEEIIADLRRLLQLSPDYSGYEMYAMTIGALPRVTEEDRDILADGARMFPEKVIMELGQAAYDFKAGRVTSARKRLEALRSSGREVHRNFQAYQEKLERRVAATEGLARAWSLYGDGEFEDARTQLNEIGSSPLDSDQARSREDLEFGLGKITEVREAIAQKNLGLAAYRIHEALKENPPEKVRAALAKLTAQIDEEKRQSGK